MKIITAKIIDITMRDGQVQGLIISTDGVDRVSVWVKGHNITYVYPGDHVDILVERSDKIGESLVALDIAELDEPFVESIIHEAIGSTPHPYQEAQLASLLAERKQEAEKRR